MGRDDMEDLLASSLEEQQGDLICKVGHLLDHCLQNLDLKEIRLMKVMLRSIVVTANNIENEMTHDPKIIHFGDWLAVKEPICTVPLRSEAALTA